MKLAHPSTSMDIFSGASKEKLILTGNEAYARGLFEAGVQFYATYPGTPVSEVGDLWEILAENQPQYHYDLAVNETVAFEEAVGVAWMGVRAAVGFKFLGMNLIADALHTVNYSGLRGDRKAGSVIICGSDPEMASSTNSEDVRLFSLHSKLPIMEPATVQECIDLVPLAFELSELWQLPVMIYSPTILNHGSSIVELHDAEIINLELENRPKFMKDATKYINAIQWARKHQRDLNQKILTIQQTSLSEIPSRIQPIHKGDKNNFLSLKSQKEETVDETHCVTGIITSGIGWDVAEELCDRLHKDLPRLRLFVTYPLTNEPILDFISQYELETLVILEELEPFIEYQIKNILKDADNQQLSSIRIIGKPIIPLEGALTVDRILQCLGTPHQSGTAEDLVPRI